MKPNHLHVETGLSGYGPDAADHPDGFTCYRTDDEAAAAVRDELEHTVNQLIDEASALADGHQFEQAWKTSRYADDLEVMRANLAAERRDAPLYKDNPALWQWTVRTLLTEHFPLALDVDGRQRVYVWPCQSDDCIYAMALEDEHLGADVIDAARGLLDGRGDVHPEYRRALAELCVRVLDPAQTRTEALTGRVVAAITAGNPVR